MDLLLIASDIAKALFPLTVAAVLGLIIAYFLQKPVKSGFDTMAVKLAETFTKSVNEQLIPTIKFVLEGTRADVLGIIKKWEPSLVGGEKSLSADADLQRYIDVGDVEGAFKAVERAETAQLKAMNYKELARICMARKERLTTFTAANKYIDLVGRTAEAYRFLGYVYWWFGDTDTAIVHTENAIQLALKGTGNREKEEGIAAIKNNLACYYAQLAIKKDLAFSYAEDALKTTPDHPFRIDTKGFVYLQFGTTEADIEVAISCFIRALELEPADEDLLLHFQKALVKKKSLQKK